MLSDAAKIDADASWLDTPQRITARIVAVQQHSAAQRLSLTHVRRSDGAVLNGTVWLYVYDRAVASGDTAWLPGDRIAVQARLHAPRNQHNPSGFDFEAWCFDRHIALLGSARGGVEVLSSGASPLEGIRQGIRRSLASLPDAQGGVLRALLLGEREAIPESVYAAFAATGAAHLLAISGLHIGLVAGFGFVLCWFVLTRREAWIVHLPVRGMAMLAGVLAAVLYAQLAGWPLPTQRAALMLGAAAVAWWLRARAEPLNILLAALMLILLLDPSAVISLSLWLSFVATAGILWWAASTGQRDHPVWLGWLAGLVAVTLIASLLTLPLVADVFGRLPVYSLPANLLATPLYSLLVLPLSLAGALCSAAGLASAAHALFALAATGVESGNALLSGISHWPAGTLWLADIPPWSSAAYLLGLGGAALLFKRGKPLVAVAVLLLSLGGFSAFSLLESAPETGQLIVWDVGQGAASSLILPGGKVMVIDAAGRPGSRFNAGTTMAEGLRGMGLTHIDVLVISHDQSDHAGGVASLMRRVNRIGELWLADVPEMRRSRRIAKLCGRVREQGGMVRWLKQGDDVSFAGSKGAVLWPPPGYAPANVNDDSLVLHLTLPGGQRLLFGGDIEATAEASILSRHGQGLAADVMLMPHHGSATSSTPAFLAAVNPTLAIAQAGYANRYGFPAAAVQQRYRDGGARLYNTADGAVRLALGADGGMRALPSARVGSDKRKRALQWWRHFL